MLHDRTLESCAPAAVRPILADFKACRALAKEGGRVMGAELLQAYAELWRWTRAHA